MLALNLACTEFQGQSKILVLYNQFLLAEHARKIVVEQHIFDDVVFIDEKFLESFWKFKWIRRVHAFANLSFENMCKKYSIEKILLFPADPMRISLMIKLILRYHPDCECYVAEDGFGTYVTMYNMFPACQKMFTSGWKGRLLFSFLGRKKYFEKIKGIYCCRPDLLLEEIPIHKRHRIPSMSLKNERLRNVFFKIFGEKEIEYHDMILLHQPYSTTKQHRAEHYQDELFRGICKRFPSAIAGVKLHPRDQIKNLGEGIPIVSADIMFEYAIAKAINTKVLISPYSTAAYTPFLLWGYTAPIIFLYDLFRKQRIDIGVDYDSIQAFTERFGAVYRKYGGKIYVPETMEDLYLDIEKVLVPLYESP